MLKRPAAATINKDAKVMKKPASAVVNEENVEKLQQLAHDENIAINTALGNALTQTRSRELQLSEWKVKIEAKTAEDSANRNSKVWMVYHDDVIKLATTFGELASKIMREVATCKDIKWHDQKIQTMRDASDKIDEADALLSELNANAQFGKKMRPRPGSRCIRAQPARGHWSGGAAQKQAIHQNSESSSNGTVVSGIECSVVLHCIVTSCVRLY